MDDVIVAREFVASVGDAVVVESLPLGAASRGCTVSFACSGEAVVTSVGGGSTDGGGSGVVSNDADDDRKVETLFLDVVVGDVVGGAVDVVRQFPFTETIRYGRA